MPEINDIQTSFGAGEVSPKVIGRIDHRRYKEGAARLENMIVTPQGSVHKRNGTEAIWAMPFIQNPDLQVYSNHSQSEVYGARAIRVSFSRAESYALCFVNHTDGVRAYIYSHQDKSFMEYQPGDDSTSTLPEKVNVNTLTIPNATDTGSITISADDYFFRITSDHYASTARLVNRKTGGLYTFPGYSRAWVEAIRWPDGTYPDNWQLRAQNQDTGAFFWSYRSPDGDANTFPTTGWVGGSYPPTFASHTYTVGSELTVDDGFEFPYTASELNDIQATVYDNTVILTHRNHPPIQLVRHNRANHVDGVDDYRYWSAKEFPFEDGPYLASDKGKQLKDGDNADYSSDNISLSLSKITDNAELACTDSSVITGGTFAVNEYIEYRVNGKIYLGRITDTSEQANGRLIIEPVENVIDDIDPVVSLESDSNATSAGGFSNITQIYSTASIFSHNLDGGAFRHSQDGGLGVKVGWFIVDRYIGQHVLTTNTNQINPGHPPHNPATVDCLSVSYINVSAAEKLHFPADQKIADQPGLTTLPSGETVYQKKRTILYTLTSSQAVFDSARDIDRWIRVKLNDEWTWGKIYEVTDSTNANVEFSLPPSINRKGNTQYATTKWQFGAFHKATGSGDNDSPANYPSAVSVFDDRLWFAGGFHTPNGLFSSVLDSYEKFSPTDETGDVLDTSGISYRISSSESSEILWLRSLENLIAGSTTAEFKIGANDASGLVTPTNIFARNQTNFGSSSSSTAAVDSSVIFIQAPGKSIRELTYSFEQDSYRSINLSVVAEHLFSTADPIQDLCSISYPDNYIFFRTKRGKLICMTYDKENRVVACTPISISGMKPYDRSQPLLDIDAWASGNGYVAGGLVQNDGEYYKCLSTHSAPSPDPASTPATWEDLNGSTRDDVTIWATSTQYYIGQCVENDGIYYQCLRTHTSDSSFLLDYSNNLWTHTGAPVVSMCSLPSQDDRSSDSIFLITRRKVGCRDTNGTALEDPSTPGSDDILCFEILEPLSPPLTDHPYSPGLNNNSFHADFHIKIQDTDSFAQLFQRDNFTRQLDIGSINGSSTANKTWYNLKEPIDNFSQRIYGLSAILHGFKTNELNSTDFIDFRPREVPNSFSPDTGQVFKIFDGCYLEDESSSLPFTSVKDSDGNELWTNDLGYSIVPFWCVGFTFPCLLKSLPVELYSNEGSSLGRYRRINEVNLNLSNTGTFSVIGNSIREYLTDQYDFTGIQEISIDNANNQKQDFSIASFSANPLSILSFSTQLHINR